MIRRTSDCVISYSTSSDPTMTLSYFKISGTPFECGEALGRFGAPVVHRHLLSTQAWASVMQWRRSSTSNLMMLWVQERFPRIWDELQGMARGLELPVEDVFLWNCRGDLWSMAPDGCTTVQLSCGGSRRITHNADGDPGFAGHCAVVECEVKGCSRFSAFIYPGSLPGHTFAVTDAGLAMTVNNLRCRKVTTGIPRMVLARAMLEAETLDEALFILQGSPRAGGFHLTVGHCAQPHLLSIEFCSESCSIERVTAPSLHANHALHPRMLGIAQRITGSSARRQARGDRLLLEALLNDLEIDPLAILSDTHDREFPIFRCDPYDSDDENTLATVDIRIGASHIDWAVFDQPSGPVRFYMKDGGMVMSNGKPAKAIPDQRYVTV